VPARRDRLSGKRADARTRAPVEKDRGRGRKTPRARETKSKTGQSEPGCDQEKSGQRPAHEVEGRQKQSSTRDLAGAQNKISGEEQSGLSLVRYLMM
jgi:hypothetical protein